MENGLVFNVQRYSVHDGPGIRTTVFLKGCPLRCAWCHNPEGISLEREIVFLENRCIGCGECRRACRFGFHVPSTGALPSRHERCEMCGRCVDACPAQARQIAGRRMSVDELLREIMRDRVFYEESGGGVTFSGGEPLAQPRFLGDMLAACKDHGLHTAVDTCGLVQIKQLLAISRLTDLFLYDLKLVDNPRHEQFTGAPNDVILNNLRALSSVHNRIWIRVPVIPGVNDAPSDLEAAARFARELPRIEQVNLLPYHRNGAHKVSRLGLETTLPALSPPSEAAMASALDIFQREGLSARIGG